MSKSGDIGDDNGYQYCNIISGNMFCGINSTNSINGSSICDQ